MSQFEILCIAENGAFWAWLNAHDAYMRERTPEASERVAMEFAKLQEIRKMIDDHRKGKH